MDIRDEQMVAVYKDSEMVYNGFWETHISTSRTQMPIGICWQTVRIMTRL